jgi:hypothetical protein
MGSPFELLPQPIEARGGVGDRVAERRVPHQRLDGVIDRALK